MGDPSPSPSELVSGPDLGGGFLHQLSRDRREETTTFTHHAQDGGQDAGGPPIGDLDRLGFAHPPSPCQFGGPRCWHRRYLLPFIATSKVRFAYQRHRFVLDTMLRQAYDLEPVPFDAALLELLGRIDGPLRSERVRWYVAGSGSVRLLGGRTEPHDVDLGTTRAGVDRLGELLGEYLIEPVAPTERADGEPVVGARAFVGTPRAGARVEWAVPLEPRPPALGDEFSATSAEVRTIDADFAGRTVPVSRPEYALVRAASRGAPAAVDAALGVVRRVGPDRALLDALLARSPLAEAERSGLRRRAVD